MASTEPKTVVIFGATGIQGGSVAKALLSDPITARQFKVRAVTRDPTKPAAKALIAQGADVGDLEDKESLNSILTGAHALFLVTNFFETYDAALEKRQGKNVADIAKKLGIKHFIWSSLPSISKIFSYQVSNNKFTAAAHFDGKAAVDEYIQSLSIPSTVVRLGIYVDVLLDFIAPLPTNPLSYGLCFPGTSNWKTTLPIIDPSADLGKFIKIVLLNPDKTIGQSYNLAEKYYTLDKVSSILQQRGLKIAPIPVELETFKSGLAAKGVPEFFQTTMEHIIQYIIEYGYFGGEGIDAGLELVNEALTSLEDSCKTNSKIGELINQQ
ncbi:hypothetical protein UA08_03154 [Talaromyces atroroseus]|uniref:NmrA-like domain-containing protein n=1 Tax=Talaromyces atroroseus TaxID=1441469 RepID=A0A225AS62_TALAT|nr:hypothetical protein UA08_03154 [Talaromyces atroroseus]OKL61194.1 hypothetical protein UA08_03154 [Talaromyces atroroseus]